MLGTNYLALVWGKREKKIKRILVRNDYIIRYRKQPGLPLLYNTITHPHTHEHTR